MVVPMAATDALARRATLRRSVRLLGEFRHERRDPDRFYGTLAADTAAMVSDLWEATRGVSAAGRLVLDVGGGPGYYATAFATAGMDYIGVEPDPREMHTAQAAPPAISGTRAAPAATFGTRAAPAAISGTRAAPSGHAPATFVRASGMALPFADATVDICLSSNVAEHVPRPWELGREMLRVTRPGGLVVLSYTVWLGPFGGHEMGLTHYLGGARAAARYNRKHGHPAKNNYGSSLFAVSAGDGLRWATETGALIAAFPRYHPRWAWWLTSVPLLREFLVSNLVLVMRPRGTTD
jgi:SAM-dependent methyltransferase